jgi:hypothetical protein
MRFLSILSLFFIVISYCACNDGGGGGGRDDNDDVKQLDLNRIVGLSRYAAGKRLK